MNHSFVKIERAIQALEQQAHVVDEGNKSIKSHYLIQNNDLFSTALFTTRSDLFLPYIEEIKRHLSELIRLYKGEKTQLFIERLSLIEQQILAVKTALNSKDVFHKVADKKLSVLETTRYKKSLNTIMKTSHELHMQLNETLEFERRLVAMVENKTQALHLAKGDEYQTLTQDVLVLQQRLGRCRKAINKIEYKIYQLEKPC